MKRNILLAFLTILVLLNSAAIGYYVYHDQKEHEENEEPPFHLMKSSDVDFPTTFSLAGEEVPLERIDVAEAFKKELIVNTYLHSHTIQVFKKRPPLFSYHRTHPKSGRKFRMISSTWPSSRVVWTHWPVSYAGAAGIWQLMSATAKEPRVRGDEWRGRTLSRGKSYTCRLYLLEKSLPEIRFLDTGRRLL